MTSVIPSYVDAHESNTYLRRISPPNGFAYKTIKCAPMMIETILTWCYVICAATLAIYTLGHGVLLIQYLRHRNQPADLPATDETHLPTVTVQLPIYNEQHVALRVLDAAAHLDYPADKLCIQLLDDSTDATSQRLTAHIKHYPHLHIQHIQRPERTGYKAGALAYGLTQTNSDFIAIFDADFIPPSDFLRQTVPYLMVDEQLAVVQTRWGHLNARDNWLTRAQVLSIDTHFMIEQCGRNRSGWMLPFNGTGGVWRTSAIYDAGGWSHATLTEDLDLSFRAQLKGWQSLFLPDVVVSGELPPQLAAYRRQQSRWAQGSSQCLRRLIHPLWQSNKSLIVKLMATQHLAQYVPHLLMLVLLLLTPPMLITGALHALPLAPLGIIGLIPPLMYAISQRDNPQGKLRNLLAFPALLLIGTGLILHNALAVVKGIFTSYSVFERTPKFVHGWQGSGYALTTDNAIVLEIILMLYAFWATWLAAQLAPALVPYLLLHALAFATVIVWDTFDQWRIYLAQSRTAQHNIREV